MHVLKSKINKEKIENIISKLEKNKANENHNINKSESFLKIDSIKILNDISQQIKQLQNKLYIENKILMNLNKQKKIDSEKYKKAMEKYKEIEKSLEENKSKKNKIKKKKIKYLNFLMNSFSENLNSNKNTDINKQLLKIILNIGKKADKNNKSNLNYLSSEFINEIFLKNKNELNDFLIHFDNGIKFMKEENINEYNKIKLFLENYLLDEKSCHPYIDLVNYIYYIFLEIEQEESIKKINEDLNHLEKTKSILFMTEKNNEEIITNKQILILKIIDKINDLKDKKKLQKTLCFNNKHKNYEKENDLNLFNCKCFTERKRKKSYIFSNTNNENNESALSLSSDDEKTNINLTKYNNNYFFNNNLTEKTYYTDNKYANKTSRNATKRNFYKDYDLSERPVKKVSIFEAFDLVSNDKTETDDEIIYLDDKNDKEDCNLLANSTESNLLYKCNKIKKPITITKVNKYFIPYNSNVNANKNNQSTLNKIKDIKIFKTSTSTSNKVISYRINKLNKNKVNELTPYKKVKVKRANINLRKSNHTVNTTYSTKNNSSYFDKNEKIKKSAKIKNKIKKFESKLINKNYTKNNSLSNIILSINIEQEKKGSSKKNSNHLINIENDNKKYKCLAKCLF